MTLTRKKIKAGGITMTVTTNVATPQEIASVMYRPGGPGDLDLKQRATAVMNRAIETAPVGKGPTAGTLKKSFFMRQARSVGGQFQSGYEVGNTAPYFLYVIKGTKPHDIVGNPLLVFDWPVAGLHPAAFRKVHHPGTKANTFFADSIRAAV